jgi:hypothetical protein
MSTSRDATKLGFLPLGVLHVGIMNLAVLPLTVLVLGVLTLAKLGFLNCTTGRFATGCFGVRPSKVSTWYETFSCYLLKSTFKK